MDALRLKNGISTAVEEAIRKKEIPGAVLLIVRNGKIVFHDCYGHRQLKPNMVPMTTDTIFDLASLTKPLATTLCVMRLIEEGKLLLNDKVSQFLPTFGCKGKQEITIEHLLLHTSGLIADNALVDYQFGKVTSWERIDALTLAAPVGKKFIYSDVGFIVLGRIVESLEGESLDQVFTKRIAKPLGLVDTRFHSTEMEIPDEVRRRCAPNEPESDGTYITGTVHDPRARLLNGVAGHAGLFGTAKELAILSHALLQKETREGVQLMKPEYLQLMFNRRWLPDGGQRCLGWDMDTGYSAPRGNGFPAGISFGHTGFTGTSLWLDPSSQTIVIILANRLHPEGKGNATPLRRNIASIVASSIIQEPKPARSPVKLGIDVLRRNGFKDLLNKRVGLITNHTGVAADGKSTIDILHQAEKVKLVALFSPEHGIRGMKDEKFSDSKDEKTGLPIFSLYGERRKPTQEQLRDVDVLVYDIQDIGCRFYTYISTMGLAMEAAAEQKIPFIILDRPNPINGSTVQGPMTDEGKENFTAYHRIPIRHGMTVGELAHLFNHERKLNAEVKVISIEGWRRGDLFPDTGLTWINPSPNMRSLNAALLYPGVGLLETTNLSVGRGTDRPFELIGAPWIDGPRLAQELESAKIPGVRFYPTRFTPQNSVHAKLECQGIHLMLDDAEKLDAIRLGYTLACKLRELYPTQWQSKNYNRLLAHEATFAELLKNNSLQKMIYLSRMDADSFLERRKPFLLYP